MLPILEQANESQEGDSSGGRAYVLEMWRVLKVGGLFIVITTMPEDIFEALAVTHIGESSGLYHRLVHLADQSRSW